MCNFLFTLYLTISVQTLLASAADNCSIIRKTKSGKVRGLIRKSRQNVSYAAFLGIPYAEPPVGLLRFAPPKEIGKWAGVRNATEDAPICIQQDFLFERYPSIEGSEDCLYINVYSPKISCHLKKSRSSLLPVIFHIHYGGFLSGNSRSDIIGPEYIMDQDVVLVTFNYRLGVMGFLSTFDDEAPGNWALKDQLAALRWVNRNIEHFGGDNRKVTIMGQSAGAGSVHHLLLNSNAKGLFHRAISMSGTALALWATPMPKMFFAVTNITATVVGCYHSHTKDMVECLRNVSAYDLVNAVNAFRTDINSEPLTPFFPALEQNTSRNSEPFITEPPGDIILKGNFNNVPWMIGVVPGDGILRAAPFVEQNDIRAKINEKFDLLKSFTGISLSVLPDQVDALWSQVADFYFPEEKNLNSSDSIAGLINLYSDRAFIYPTYQSILLHNFKGHQNMFVYNFDYRGKYSYGDIFAGTSNNTLNYKWGASHCDDLLYVFASPGRFPNSKLSDLDSNVSEAMLNFLNNFVEYGDPTPQHLFQNRQRWEPISNNLDSDESLHFLTFSGSFEDKIFQLNLTNGFYLPRMHFWRNKSLFENRYLANLTV